MKKSLVFLASVGLLLVGCGNNTQPTDKVTATESGAEVTTVHFEKDVYQINPGDKVAVKENVTGVVYSFQGGTPEGVVLNAETGEITFDPYGAQIPEKVYIATYKGKSVSTKVSFLMKEELPVLAFLNPSNYLIDGDSILCEAKSEKGREFAVTYTLKEAVEGVSLNAENGKVSFSAGLANLTPFTVVCESKGVTKENTFYAMTADIITAENEVILEKGKTEDAFFTLDFKGNEAATKEDVKLLVEDKLVNVEGFDYDPETKTVKIPASYLSTLSSGEHSVKVTTKRNAVSLSLAIADKILYQAEDFETIFGADYSATVPTFKENSLSGYYALGCDIDLGSYIKEHGWNPIGAYCEGDTPETTYDVPFSGVFNGNGYELKNFTYTANGAVRGLFGRVSGTVKNLRLSGAIERVYSWAGGLVGNNKGTIENILLDLDLANEGQNATGVLCSVNHGYIQNVVSLSDKVNGNIDPALSWRQSGILVGLNETDGTVRNVYGIGKEGDALIGFSNNSEVTNENCGRLFADMDALRAFDFASVLPGRYFSVEENLPVLKTLSVSHTPGYFEFQTIPQYALKGAEIDLSMKILPSEREEEYNSKVVYQIDGENYGATIDGNKLNLANINAAEGGSTLSIKATLKLDDYGVDLTREASILLYNSVGGLTITNQETTIDAGTSLAITTATTPASDIKATFTATSEVSHDSVYYSMKDNVLTIRQDAPEGLAVTVTASALDETTSKTFTVKKLHTFVGNNLVHYQGEENEDFVYTVADLNGVTSMTLDGKELASENYTYADHTITIKAGAVTDTGIQHDIKLFSSDNKAYQLYAAKEDSEKVTMDWLLNCFGSAALTRISTAQEFMSYFPVDGAIHTDMAANFARGKIYVLTADLDFTGIDYHPAGYHMLGEEDNQIMNADFYGLGHSIKNVTINSEGGMWGVGFFTQIGGEEQKNKFSDINFENLTIHTGGGNFVGGLSGFLGDSSIINHVSFYNSDILVGEMTTSKNQGAFVGGLFGKTFGKHYSYCVYNGYNIHITNEN